jgi:hypothetical protein
MDEDVRPFGHARDLRPFVGSYAIRMRCDTTINARSKKAARDQLRRQLDARAIELEGAEQVVTIQSLSVAEGELAPRPTPLLEETPSLVWFEGRNDRQVHDAMLEVTELFNRVHLAGPTDEEKTELPRFDARFSLTFQCARALWARDESHARHQLDEDVAVLLTPDSLDRWLDDQVGLDTRILRVAEHEEVQP